MIRKGRERIDRGVLKSFYDLPEQHRIIFIEVKNKILNSINNDEKVFIYGSFLWGDWDESSDYDVYIKQRQVENLQEFFRKIDELKNELKNELKVKVDIVMMRHDIGILIP